MKCNKCGEFIFVDYSNILRDGTISRRRTCSNCGNVVHTIEVSRVEYDALKRLAHDLRWTIDKFLVRRKEI